MYIGVVVTKTVVSTFINVKINDRAFNLDGSLCVSRNKMSVCYCCCFGLCLNLIRFQ